MRSFLPRYDVVVPRDLEEALGILSIPDGQWKPLAGGTDIMVLLEAGKLPHHKFVNLSQLAELTGIGEENGRIKIGALTTFTQIQRSDLIREHHPLLCKAAACVGAIAIQNRATIGGNIANASPAADSPPVLLAIGAEIEIASTEGTRTVAYESFHTGYKTMDLKPGELIQAVWLPIPRKGTRPHEYFRKVGTRQAQAISKICLAATAAPTNKTGVFTDLRVCVGSVAPTVIRCRAVEKTVSDKKLTPALIDQALRLVPQDIAPIDDIRSTREYRTKVTTNLIGEFLAELMG